MTDYDREISDLETECIKLQNKITPLSEKIQKLNKKLRELREKRDEAIDPATLGVADYLSCSPGETMASHRRAKEFFLKMGFHMSGYYSQTNQRSIQIMAYKSRVGEVDRIMAAMETVIPHVIPIDGAKRFEIVEHTLSEDGIYSLRLLKDDRATIFITVYGSDRAILTDVPLKEAIEYIVENLYYK